ncbi:MAG: c-type cytochrome [Phycisphaerales bacterium]|nr:c-type cytochrome [Phycisphaerales bacterium]
MKSRSVVSLTIVALGFVCLGLSCPTTGPVPNGDGMIAENISAPQGEIIPSATDEQKATFERGKAIMAKRFDLADGLGPAFNVTFCGACHERPVAGGSSGLYRNFFIGGRLTNDGAFIASQSAGMAGGVLRVFNYDENEPARPEVPTTTTIFAQRNAIPMFGVGLIAELTDEELLSRADPDDADGDGISGRANFEAGFVGRFGRKSQTASIEGFIRGPLFNHLGVTTDALTDAQRAALPVASDRRETTVRIKNPDPIREMKSGHRMQVAVSDASTIDDDDVADPEMTTDELFDLVSFTMLLAAPQLEELGEQGEHGRQLFHDANCSACHAPRVQSPRGPLPVYSDFLLHDMGDDLADGIVQGVATASEFRTQPLWGICSTGPYLHDGRAATIEEAILAHGGEAQAARDAFANFSDSDKADLVEFLFSLGGRTQVSAGLLPPDAEVPATGQYGGPSRDLSEFEMQQFIRGRAVFDEDFEGSAGSGGLVGADMGPRFNGDSCRACHFDPVIGGAGPRDVNVMRHGIVSNADVFSAPSETPNTILHKEIKVGSRLPTAETGINVFEMRQTPHVFGLGLIDTIAESTIMDNADPNDSDTDGISGRAHILPGGRVGRFGWKAQIPSVADFVGDAFAAEIGLTVPAEANLPFAITSDDDGVADPEVSMDQVNDLIFFMRTLGPPPRQPVPAGQEAAVANGEMLFTSVGCAKCHKPALAGANGLVPLFSDLLLHEILPASQKGIVDTDAGQREFRTAPLWGLSKTAPYFHNGAADTIDEAIRMHDAEALSIRQAYEGLSQADRDALLAFLGTL